MAKYEEKVSLEVAEEEFERFVEENDLLLDPNKMDEEDRTSFEHRKERLVREIRRGFLTLNEDGVFEFTPYNKNSKSKEKLTFHQRTGKSLMNVKPSKNEGNITQMYKVLADMCKVSVDVFAGLAGNDIKVCETIFSFLMD